MSTLIKNGSIVTPAETYIADLYIEKERIVQIGVDLPDNADEVIDATKEALRKGMPGGGFILSSSNSIHSAVKPENYLALLQTLREYGQYS